MLVVDDEMVLIKDYINILLVNDHYFKIEMKECYYHINGKNIMIHYLDNYEIRLSGQIDVITYDKF
ncbi:MAG: YabP/YqfC family sporulation protein [Erysipelotrichaceae bacterium]|nr:YabP/YqfC family sporulation protein [Erysipelotrichaceae bacterium]